MQGTHIGLQHFVLHDFFSGCAFHKLWLWAVLGFFFFLLLTVCSCLLEGRNLGPGIRRVCFHSGVAEEYLRSGGLGPTSRRRLPGRMVAFRPWRIPGNPFGCIVPLLGDVSESRVEAVAGVLELFLDVVPQQLFDH